MFFDYPKIIMNSIPIQVQMVIVYHKTGFKRDFQTFNNILMLKIDN